MCEYVKRNTIESDMKFLTQCAIRVVAIVAVLEPSRSVNFADYYSGQSKKEEQIHGITFFSFLIFAIVFVR